MDDIDIDMDVVIYILYSDFLENPNTEHILT